MRKIRWCRAAALLLSTALILPACMSSGRPSERKSAAPEEMEAESAAETEEAAAGEDWKEERIDQMAQLLRKDLFYYGFEEPVTLKVGYSYDSVLRWAQGEGPTDNVWTRLYEKLGIEADVLFNVDSTQLDTRLATAMAADNYPDILCGSITDMVQYAREGKIADITEVFEEYASDELKEYLNYGGIDVLDSCMLDGKLYGLAQACESQIEGMMMFVRQDWLDRLGLSMPETMDELKAVTKAFTEEDPDGNGVDDTYGLVLNGKDGFTFWSGVQAFFEGYGAAPGYWSDNFTFIEKDGEVLWGGALAEEMKAGLTDLQEMYENGWLTREFGTMGYEQVIEEFTSGRCGIFFAPRWGVMSRYVPLLESDINAEVSAALIPDGMGEGSSMAYVPMTTANVWMVSSQCEHPEALVKLMNLSVRLLADYESEEERQMFVSDVDGFSGWKAAWISFQKPGSLVDSIVRVREACETGIISEEMTEENVREYQQLLQFLEAKENGTLAGLLEEGDPDITAGAAAAAYYPGESGGKVMLEQLEEGRIVYSTYNTTPTERMASCYSVLNKLTFETIIRIICGEDVESYDAFLESWMRLGGAEATEQAQEWYEENVNEK